MPEYEHQCLDENCGFYWEETYSIKVDPPKICPKCSKETAQRLISGGSGKGIVQLSGEELKAKVNEDIKALKRNAATSQNVAANLIGEDRYHKSQTSLDRSRKW